MEPPPPPSSSSDQTRDNAIISGEITATELATIRLRVHRWLDSIPDEAREQSAARLDPSDQQDHDRIPSADGEGEHISASSVGDVEDGVPEARRSRHHRVIDDSVVYARRRDIEDSVVEARQRRQQQRDIDDSVVLARRLGIDYAYYPDGELEERYEHNKRPSNGECFICYSRNHRARQCPQNAKTRIPALRDANRGQCFICYGYHLAIHCPNNWINRPGGGGDDSGGVGDLGSLCA